MTVEEFTGKDREDISFEEYNAWAKYLNLGDQQLQLSRAIEQGGGIPMSEHFIAPKRTADIIKEDKEVNKIDPSSGLMGGDPPEPWFNYSKSLGDKIIGKKKGGSQIVFGRDRPGSIPSGFGGSGASRANAIDIVVGRASSAKLKKGAWVAPNIASDAARIYISQLTDIDTNFGLADGENGNVQARSGIGIKADSVRIVAREGGVKITTGRSFAFGGAGPEGEKNSLGGNIRTPAPPIELIAGNTSSPRMIFDPEAGGVVYINTLQGVAMGENTKDAIRELSDLLEELMGTVFSLALLQLVYNSVNSVDYWRPWMAGQGATTATGYCQRILSSLWMTRISKKLWEVNYTYPFGQNYIPSRNVFST